MHSRISFAFIFWLGIILLPSFAVSESERNSEPKRLALVIGNSNYKVSPHILVA